MITWNISTTYTIITPSTRVRHIMFTHHETENYIAFVKLYTIQYLNRVRKLHIIFTQSKSAPSNIHAQ